ncbi:MAG: GNAT family N-acetyltransferase [Candidatus Heimdallarchaeaceae archaeon]
MSEKNEDISLIEVRKGKYDETKEITALWIESILWHSTFDNDFELDKDGKRNFEFVLKTAIADNSQEVYVAEKSGRIVGFLYGYIKNQTGFFKRRKVAHISDIVVKKEFRNQGIGSALFEKFEREFAFEHQAEDMTLFVHVKNEKAIEFYKKIGFEIKLLSMKKLLKAKG